MDPNETDDFNDLLREFSMKDIALQQHDEEFKDRLLCLAEREGVDWKDKIWVIVEKEKKRCLEFLSSLANHIIIRRLKFTVEGRILQPEKRDLEKWELEFVKAQANKFRVSVIFQDSRDREHNNWFFPSELDMVKSSVYNIKLIIEVENPELAAQGLRQALARNECRLSLWRHRSHLADEEIQEEIANELCSVTFAANAVVLKITGMQFRACSHHFGEAQACFFFHLSSSKELTPPECKFVYETLLCTTTDSDLLRIVSRKKDVHEFENTKTAVLFLREPEYAASIATLGEL